MKQIKKVLAAVLMGCMLLTSTEVTEVQAGNTAVAASTEYVISKDGRFQYKVYETEEENYIHIDKYLGNETSVVIPDTIDGYVVRGLRTSMLYENEMVEEIEIPNTILYVQSGTFEAAYALKNIHMKDGFENAFHTEDGVLYNGGVLHSYPSGKEDTTFVIPNSVGNIQAYAFYGCVNLEKIIIPQNTSMLALGAKFARCKNPLDIVIKKDTYESGYLDDVCWQMLEGTRILVANEELAEQYAAEMTDNDYYAYTLNGTHYIEVDKPMAVEVYDSVPSTDLTFADGTREKDITVTYNPDADDLYTNLYTKDNECIETAYLDFIDDFVQYPADTTENVYWKTTNEDGSIMYHDSSRGIKAGGHFTVTGYDDSGHEITANITVYCPVEEFYLENADEEILLSADDVESGKTTTVSGVLDKTYSYAYMQGVTWEIEDMDIAQIVDSGMGTRNMNPDSGKAEKKGYIWCKLQGLKAGRTTLTATINDDDVIKTQSVDIAVEDTIENATIDTIPAQYGTGKQICPKPVVRYQGEVLEEGKDYQVKYGLNKSGTGKVTVVGKGVFYGTQTATFTIRENIQNCAIADISHQKEEDILSGKYPDITITHKDYTLVKGTDYTVKFHIENEDSGLVTITGIGAYYGEWTVSFDLADDIKECEIKSISAQKKSDILAGNYPDVTVTQGSYTLVNKKDYTLKFAITDRNKASVTVTGMGAYYGEQTVEFNAIENIRNCKIWYIPDQNKSDISAGKYPDIQITQEEYTLVEGKDYELQHSTASKDRGSVKITGINDYTGTQTVYYTIIDDTPEVVKTTLTSAMITFPERLPLYKDIEKGAIKGTYDYTWTSGKDVLNNLHVTCNGKELVMGTDYTVKGKSSIWGAFDIVNRSLFIAGDYSLVITGIEDAGYTGSVTVDFNIYSNSKELKEQLEKEENQNNSSNANGNTTNAGNSSNNSGNTQDTNNTNNGSNTQNTGNNSSGNTANQENSTGNASVQKHLTVTKTVAYGTKAFAASKLLTIEGKATYKSSNKAVAKVSSKGKITIKSTGYAEITVKDATGTKIVKLYVTPKTAKITYAVSAKKKTLTVKWERDKKASGYSVEYSLKKNFKNSTKVDIPKNKTTSTTIKKLKSKKKYYVRVAAYTVIEGEKYYGKYTKAKKIKIR